MHSFAKLPFVIAALTQIVSGARLDLEKRESALAVTLAAVENGVVKATVTNTGAEDLNLLTFGSIFDSAPVQKLDVYATDAAVEFTGILRSVQRTGLASESFISIPAGSTYETTINAAAVHDLSSGGTFSVVAQGSVPYAKAGSTELSGSAISYKSNALTIEVDGAAAAAVPRAVNSLSLEKRAAVQTSSCPTSQRSATLTALSNCRTLSLSAASAARSGSAAKFQEYFKTTAAATRTAVANRFTAVANECGSSTSGATYYYCTDVYGYCGSNVLAYTIPSTDEVVNCPLYYSAIPALSGTCHAQDRATTTLHEFTHAPGVYSPGTQDNGYGYAAATSLTAARALANADSYALYANAIYVGC